MTANLKKKSKNRRHEHEKMRNIYINSPDILIGCAWSNRARIDKAVSQKETLHLARKQQNNLFIISRALVDPDSLRKL